MTTKDSLKTITNSLSTLLQSITPLTDIQVLSNSTPQILRVSSVQYQPRDSKKSTLRTSLLYDPTSSSPITKLSTFPTTEPGVDQDELSPSKALRALFRKEGDKTTLEIWGGSSLYRYLNVTEQHGIIYDDVVTAIRPITWSQDENRIMYLAEAKKDKKPKYFEEAKSDEDAKKSLENFEYSEDFGEALIKKSIPQLFVYDIKEDALYQVKNINEGCVPIQASFADKSGNSLLFTALQKDDFSRGLNFCLNRNTKVHYAKKLVLKKLTNNTPPDGKKKEESEIKAEEEAMKQEIAANQPVRLSEDDISIFPIFNDDFTKIAFLFSPMRAYHNFIIGLKVIEIDENFPEKPKTTTVLDIVQDRNENFNGISGYHDVLKRSSWIKGTDFFVFNTYFESSMAIFIVDTKTSEVRRIDTPKFKSEVWVINAVESERIYARVSNIESPAKFAIFEGIKTDQADLNSALQSAKWNFFEFEYKLDQFLNSEEKNKALLSLGEVKEHVFEVKGIQGILFSVINEAIPDKNRPLLVNMHGGPHGVTTGMFSYFIHYALSRGYNVLFPNFSGSLGFGQKLVDNLIGKCGEIDIEEVKAHIDNVVEKELCDPKKLVAFGGSYSGFQIAVFLSKYPTLFKVAIKNLRFNTNFSIKNDIITLGILKTKICATSFRESNPGKVNRNPVLDLLFFERTSDIPEWVRGEYFNEGIKFQWSDEEIKKAIEASPLFMSQKGIETSYLLLVGAKDVRVPYQQSVYYYKMLKSRGVDITFRCYPEFGHGLLGSLEGEFDVLVNQVAFMESKI